MDNYNYNETGSEDALTLSIDLNNIADAALTFDVAYQPFGLFDMDELRVDISADCGATFTQGIYAKTSALLATTPATGSAFFPANADQWRREMVDLTPYVGNSVVIKIVNVNGS